MTQGGCLMTPSQRCVRYESRSCSGWAGEATGHRRTLVLCLQELETGVVDLLIPSPNATAEVGYNRDR